MPTPALVAPIEFTLSREDFATLGGHVDHIVPLAAALKDAEHETQAWSETNPWPVERRDV